MPTTPLLLRSGRHAEQLTGEDFALMRTIGTFGYLAVGLILGLLVLLPHHEHSGNLADALLAAGAALSVNPDTTLLLNMPTLMVVALLGVVTLAVRERDDRLVARLEKSATTDALTGLVNRRVFSESVERELERARRSELPLSVAVFDLDHFKAINDRLGQAAGDLAIRRFSEVLHAESRTVDVAGRLGGEEFALLLTDCDAEGAKMFADRFIRRLQLYTRQDAAPLGVSIGIAEMHHPTDTQDVLMLAADRALYEAKATGRGRCVIAATPLTADAAA
jgi:diguanylate cyclase (GGDEF)-like protein